MALSPRSGRPRASSRETLAEAACELFLERGYEATSVRDITTRAGLSRSSFFNYFSSKADILWATFDDRLQGALAALNGTATPRRAVTDLAAGFAPDTLALGIVQATAMGIDDELERERAVRQNRLAHAIAHRLRRDGADHLAADVVGAAYSGALFAALWRWAHEGAGRSDLASVVARALRTVPPAPSATVKQLRLVITASDFDRAVGFYRDDLGMPQAEAYEADEGARVVILDAGRATLEIANTAQVAFIDSVETDGGSSDRLRVGFEVDDTRAVTERLTDAGAEVEASARPTPWRSLNARLRAPADLQVTLFQELDAPE